MELNVDGVAPGSDNQQVAINSEKIRQRVNVGLGNISLIRTIDLRNIILFKAKVVKNADLAKVAIPVEQVPMSQVRFLYDIKIVNSLPLADRNMNTVIPSCIIELKKDIIHDIIDMDIPVSGTAVIRIYELFAAFKFVTKYCNKILTEVPLVADKSERFHKNIVDFSKMGERNLIKIYENVKDKNLRASLISQLRSVYQEGSAPTIPEYAKVDKETTARDSELNYSKIVLPLMPLEQELLHSGESLFASQYVHPRSICTFMEKYQTDDFVIDSKVKSDIFLMPINIRVPKPYKQIIDMEIAYKIPSTRNEFVKMIRGMSQIAVEVESTNDSVRAFTDMLNLNANTSTPLSHFTSYCTSEGMVQVMEAMHACGVNRNLFTINIGNVGIKTLDNLYATISILICQMLYPADVIRVEDRRLINNGIARYLLNYKVKPFQRADIRNALIDKFPHDDLPDESAINDGWANATIDWLSRIYYVLGSRKNMNSELLAILRLYFNNLPHMEAIEDNDIGQLKGLWAPYLYGYTGPELLRDHSRDDLRAKANMQANGVVWIGIKANGTVDPSAIYERRMQLFSGLFTKLEKTNVYTSASSRIAGLLSYLQMESKSRFMKFVEYYKYRMVEYSSSVCADSTFRNIPPYHKVIMNVNFTDSMGILLRVSATAVLNDALRPYYLDGTTGMIRMSLFVIFYRMIRDICQKYDQKFTNSDRIDLANKMTANAIGISSFDAQDEFKVESTDSAEFLNFIEEANVKLSDDDYVKYLMQTITQVAKKMSSLHRELGFISRFFIVKDSLCYNDMASVNGTPIIATNAIPISRIRVKHTYHKISDLFRDMELTVQIDGKPRMKTTGFNKRYHSLKQPEVEKMRNNTAIFEAIEVKLLTLVTNDIILENGTFNKINPKVHKIDELREFVGRNIEKLQGPTVFKLSSFTVMNNAGSEDNAFFMEYDGDGYMHSMLGSQLIIAYEDLPFRLLTPVQLTTSLNSTFIVRKKPFDIKVQQHIPFRFVNGHV